MSFFALRGDRGIYQYIYIYTYIYFDPSELCGVGEIYPFRVAAGH